MPSSSGPPLQPPPYPPCTPCPCPDNFSSDPPPTDCDGSGPDDDFSGQQPAGDRSAELRGTLNEAPSAPSSVGSPSGFSANPVRYFNGEIKIISTDLQSFNFGGNWGHVRSYSNQLNVLYDGPNGNNWFMAEAPMLSNPNADPNDPNSATIVAMGVINHSLWFDYELPSGSAAIYVPRFDIKDTLTHDATLMEFIQTDTQGRVTRFHDFNVTAALRGKFKSYKDPFGHTRTAIYDANNRLSSIEQTVTGVGTCAYSFAYILSGANVGKILSVTYAVETTAVRRCLYDYYGTGASSGNLNDLKLVTLQEYGATSPPPSSSSPGWTTLGYVHYRYYTADGATGFKYGLKYVLGPEGFARLAASTSPPTDPTTATDSQVAQYASHYFEYDSKKRVTKEIVNGGLLTYTYGYGGSGLSPNAYNTWNTRTTETTAGWQSKHRLHQRLWPGDAQSLP